MINGPPRLTLAIVVVVVVVSAKQRGKQRQQTASHSKPYRENQNTKL